VGTGVHLALRQSVCLRTVCLSRSGPCGQSAHYPSDFTCFQQGSFAPPALPGFLATMSPSDTRTSRLMVIDSHQAFGFSAQLWRVSQVSRPIFACALSPSTPESPMVCVVRCSPSVAGFIVSERLAAFNLPNEAVVGSLSLRLTRSPSEASHGQLPESRVPSANC